MNKKLSTVILWVAILGFFLMALYTIRLVRKELMPIKYDDGYNTKDSLILDSITSPSWEDVYEDESLFQVDTGSWVSDTSFMYSPPFGEPYFYLGRHSQKFTFGTVTGSKYNLMILDMDDINFYDNRYLVVELINYKDEYELEQNY